MSWSARERSTDQVVSPFCMAARATPRPVVASKTGVLTGQLLERGSITTGTITRSPVIVSVHGEPSRWHGARVPLCVPTMPGQSAL